MISLKKEQQILIDFHQNGKSQRTIAKKLGMSRNTVKKYIDQDLVARKQDTRKLPIPTNFVMTPAYKKRVSPKKALTKSALV
ncbi:TPA: helix-turn-helix domain-containing protein [Bacillus tropicus]|uniref:helix-turn-helix domain-containing protein n=1 Tax=Bacillus tropicus TaxID=2026188 RepID=UPI00003CB5B1|nr:MULTISPECIES: helix-turn-helix domain-containing protein [Bacillus cereus group]AIY72880.1 helix-turn-helix family protein [Bacillus cereus]EAL15948.1 transposase [Bacillus cereus G9241]